MNRLIIVFLLNVAIVAPVMGSTTILRISSAQSEDRQVLYISWDRMVPGGDENPDPPRLTALDLITGDTLWHVRESDRPRDVQWGPSLRPFLVNRFLILVMFSGDRKYICGFDTDRNGELAWHLRDAGSGFNIAEFILTDQGKALDPETGKTVWTIESWEIAERDHGLSRQIDVDTERREFAVVREEAGDSPHLRISIYRLQDGKMLREHRVAYSPGPGPLGGFAGVNHQDGRTVVETRQDGRSLLYVFDGAEGEPRQYAAEITMGLTRLFSPHSWLYWERSSWGAVGWLDVRTGERHETKTITWMMPDPRSDSAMLGRYGSPEFQHEDGLYRIEPKAGTRELALADMAAIDSFRLAGFDGKARVAYTTSRALTLIDLDRRETVWTRAARPGEHAYFHWYNTALAGALYQDGWVELYCPNTGNLIGTKQIR